MKTTLYYNTVTPLLHSALTELMKANDLTAFRLVGGTSLSLQLGHRESVDIDMFTDAEYKSIDFVAIENYLRANFKYVDTAIGLVSFGKAFYIGESAENFVKLDLYYTDSYIRPTVLTDGIRLADIEDIIAMKIDVIQRKGRKKDFWDLHELLDAYSIDRMLELHKERYPYSHDRNEIINNLTFFDKADEDDDPICMRGKYWEVIKLDFVEEVEKWK